MKIGLIDKNNEDIDHQFAISNSSNHQNIEQVTKNNSNLSFDDVLEKYVGFGKY
jgi:hypothetical protein